MSPAARPFAAHGAFALASMSTPLTRSGVADLMDQVSEPQIATMGHTGLAGSEMP